MTRTIISCERVSKRFRIPQQAPRTLKERVLHPISARTVWKEFQALNSVGFDVAEGEFFGIVGRNGSGKSTMLKVLAGIYKADSGRVDINGTLASFIELGVGFNMDLSGRENLFINGVLLGMSRKELRRRYDAIVEFAELGEFMDMRLRNYSSGMQVRLAFSVAVESGSDILLTDEVLAVGDERFQEKCFDVFRERRRRGTTIIFVSHDMAAIERFCDRAMVLEHGEIQGIGDPGEMTNLYREINLGPGSAPRGDVADELPTSEESAPARLWTPPQLEIDIEQKVLSLASAKRRKELGDFAVSAYDTVLRRPATTDDVSWITKDLLLHSQTKSDVVESLHRSSEYKWIKTVDHAAQHGLRARLHGQHLDDISAPHGAECLVELPWILSRVPRGGSVLDIGSAECVRTYREVLESLDDCSVTTLDSRPHEFQDVTPIISDARRMPLADASMDCGICMGTLQFIGREDPGERAAAADHADVERVLTELGRVVRPDGVILISVPTGERDDNHTFFQETPETWIGLLERAALTVQQSEIYDLSKNGWTANDSFTPAGIRYGTYGGVASAILCIQATPAPRP